MSLLCDVALPLRLRLSLNTIKATPYEGEPLKQWKLSPMDLQRWENCTKAKQETLARTNIPEAPWFIVEGNDKKRARLNCIHHLLDQIPYKDIPNDAITLPDRVFNPNYERQVLPSSLYVPKRY